MDILWAPWRIRYIRKKQNKKCIFCAAKKPHSKDYLIIKTKYSISLLNTFPYNNGHAMVSPGRHIADISKLTDAEILDLFKTLNETKSLLGRALKPHGYNIGMNLSRSAGAGIPGHLHIHIVPRWHGDINFMPLIANTKVIIQSLEELYKRLMQLRHLA